MKALGRMISILLWTNSFKRVFYTSQSAALGTCGVLAMTMAEGSSKTFSSPYPPIQTPPAGSLYEENAVTGMMNYVHPSVDVAHVRRAATGDDSTVKARWQTEPVLVHNARGMPCSLEREGFELMSSPLVTTDLRDMDFLDSAQVIQQYYPHCEALLRQRLGPSVQVKAFDHNVRMAAAQKPPLKNAGDSTVQVPLGLVHGDYTATSAPRRLAQLAQPPQINDAHYRPAASQQAALLDDATVVQQALDGRRRYAFINVWRSIDKTHPVTSYPLAVCNATTVRPSDLRTLQIHYAQRVGENYLVAPPPPPPSNHQVTLHQWLYFPDMIHDEALLILQWDSMPPLQETPFCVHSAFGLPAPTNGILSNPRPRQSIEVRCVCIWDTQEHN